MGSFCGVWGKVADAGRTGSALSRALPCPVGYQLSAFVGQAGYLGQIEVADRGTCEPQAGLRVVIDGQIDNLASERRRLEKLGVGEGLDDASVVAHLYLELGHRFTKRLKGAFAIAVIDARDESPASHRVLLCRDAMGCGRLYFAATRGMVFFATAVRSILAAGEVSRKVDSEALIDFFSYGAILKPRTLFQHVHCIERGATYVVDAEGKIERHVSQEFPPHLEREETYEAACVRMRRHLDQAFDLATHGQRTVATWNLRNPRPYGAALLSERVPGATVWVGIAGGPRRESALLALNKLGARARHTEVPAEAASDFQTWAAALDGPSSFGFDSALLARAAAQSGTVVLDDLGASMMFADDAGLAQMQRLEHWAWASAARTLGNTGWRAMANLPMFSAHRYLGWLASWRSPEAMWAAQHAVLPEVTVAEILRLPGLVDVASRVRRLCGPGIDYESAVGVCSLLDATVEMQSLQWPSLVGALAPQEGNVRAPFLDISVIEAWRATKDEYKRPSGLAAQRRAATLADAVLPQLGTVDLRTEPMSDWRAELIRGPLKDLAADACDPHTLRTRGAVDPEGVQATFARHPELYYQVVWLLMCLEVWNRQVADG